MTEDGNDLLKGTRYIWITGEENLSDKQSDLLKTIKQVAKKTSKAWMLKEVARNLWNFTKKHHALKAWKAWCQDAMGSKLVPIQGTAQMVTNHLQGIITAILLKVTNAKSEALNNRIQQIKRRACGLNLYPA